MSNIEQILHEDFQKCYSCKKYFCSTVQAENQNKLCLDCFGLSNTLENYQYLIKKMGKLNSYILSTPVKNLDIEIAKNINFINKKVKRDLIKYLELNQV